MKRVKNKIADILSSIKFSESDKSETGTNFANSELKQDQLSNIFGAEKLGVFRPVNPQVGGLEKSMSAAAFAEAGEFDFAQEILSPESKLRTVLLVIERDTPNANAIEYTVNLCKRIGAIMDVLITTPFGSNSTDSMTAQSAGQYAQKILELTRLLRDRGITYHMYTLDGDLVKNLGNYVRYHKDITTVVYDSPRIDGVHSKDDIWHKVLDTICTRLSIPLITVFDKHRSKLTT